jgi:hypothetical protein
MKITHLLWVAVMCFPILSFSQSIPNNGFETWNNPNGYNVPDGWTTFNDLTSSMSVYTCTKGTPGSPGTSYIKLVSKNVSGMGVVPGVAISGGANMSTSNPAAGFSCSVKPTALTGKWQYMGGTKADIGFISVVFTLWDSGMGMRDTVGTGYVALNGMAMSWANFSIPISYSSAMMPDSCTIVLSASGSNPVANSYLYVDNLGFTGVTTSIDEISDFTFESFPNPFQNSITVKIPDAFSNMKLEISILNEVGQVVKYQSLTSNGQMQIVTSDLTKGIYILNIKSGSHSFQQKLIKS